jgi:soluble lytic murein transglycosylase
LTKKLTRRLTTGVVVIAAVLLLADGATANSIHLPPRPPEHLIKEVQSRTETSKLAPEQPVVRLKLKVDDGSFLIGKLIDKFRESHRLSEEDAARYANIFAFQDTGDFEKANAEIGKLKDYRLMGHVLYQRYLSPSYKASYGELSEWMSHYSDHPGAERIYEMAQRRQPKGAGGIESPKTGRGIPGYQDFDVGQLAQPYLSDRELDGRERVFVRSVQDIVSESPTSAMRRLDAARKAGAIGGTAADALQAEIAQSFFYNGKTAKAYEYAAQSSDRAKEQSPLAGWIAGLSAWKAGHYQAAAKYFERTAQSRRSSAWMAAAGAHWTARSLLRARQPEKVSYWLGRAAQYPRTFYGIISLKALGLEQSRFDWDVPDLSRAHVKALSAAPSGRRALALADAGNPALVAAELKAMNPGDDATLQEAMVTLAVKAGVPDVALRMGSAFKSKGGGLYDAALYPDAPWHPPRGFAVDRALVYAFIRQESKFDATANNRWSGAIGLMQLMPATAAHVARAAGQKLDARDIRDPNVNIDLGQRYIGDLLQDPSVGGNLFKLAAAYNAGPGKLARWEREEQSASTDPLLFVESIPVAETRIFVERVMTNFWIYRIKYGQSTESLDRVASGQWPVYVAQDIRRGRALADAFLSR